MKIGKRSFTAKGLVEKIEEGPVRFLVPGVVVAALAVSAVNGYTPLEFTAPEASADTAATENLDKTVDASKLEKKKSSSKKVKAATSTSTGDLVDGTYTGYSRCTEDGVFDYWLSLDVTVSGGKVTNISNVKGSGTGRSGSANLGTYDTRNAKYLNWAVDGRGSQEGVVGQLLDGASSIDTVSGATYSSESILEAYQDALSQASASGISAAASLSTGNSKKTAAKSKKSKTKTNVSSSTKLADGTWTGYDRCTEDDEFDYWLVVDVTVKRGKVTKLSNIHGSGTGDTGSADLGDYDTINDTYLNWAINGHNSQTGVLKQIEASIKKGKIASSIDTVSGATYSSTSILKAYLNALEKSAKAAGSSAAIPSATNETDAGTGEEDTSESGETSDTSENPNSGFTDGTYTAYGFAGSTTESLEFASYYVGVTISVANGAIVQLTAADIVGDAEGVVDPAYIYDAGENAYYFKRAINGYGVSGNHPGLVTQINAGLEAGSALVGYDAVSGATYTSDAIIEAYTAAVALAKGGAEASATTGDESGAAETAGAAEEDASSDATAESASEASATDAAGADDAAVETATGTATDAASSSTTETAGE